MYNLNKDQIAIVTGASRGIGRAVGLGLSKQGYKVLLFARSENALQEVADEISTKYPNSPKSEIYPCDLTDSEKVINILDQIKIKYKNIDILVNNAGVYKAGSIEHSLDDFKDLLDVNIAAHFLFLKAIIPVMKDQGYGYIFNIASRAGKIGFAGSGFYSSSKFALVGLSESLYRELAKHNIKVTALCPSYVNTSMAFDAGASISEDEMIQVEDIAQTIGYLLNLSTDACIREIVIECRKTIL